MLNHYIVMGSPWKAIGDESRRQMLVMLKDEEKTPSQLAAHFRFTFPAVSTHLRVLRDAGLVLERKEGKNRFYSVNFEKISEMLGFFDGFWKEGPRKKGGHERGRTPIGPASLRLRSQPD